jgi:hypothetical protein
MAQHLRERMNKWNCIKLKSCTAKETVTRLETAHTMGENICQFFNLISDFSL